MENKNSQEKQFEKAILEDDSKKVLELLKAGLNPNTPISDTEGNKRHPLLHAATNGYDIIVKLLLWKGVDINIRSPDGDTPLMLAAYNGEVSVVKLLIEKGAKLDLQDIEGKTALMSAVEDKHIECVKLLLEAGANIKIYDEERKNVIVYAIEISKKENNHEFILELLKDDFTAFYLYDNMARLPKVIKDIVYKKVEDYEKEKNKRRETKHEETKHEETKHEETKREETKREETKREENENQGEPTELQKFYTKIKLPTKKTILNTYLNKPIYSKYKYPVAYTTPIPFENIKRVPILKGSDFYNLLFRNIRDKVCLDYHDYLSSYTNNSFNPYEYGYVYENERGEMVGFVLFRVDEFARFNNVPSTTTVNSELNVPYGSEILTGILRCSKMKGIGAVIQSDFEDFARTNKIPLMKIEPADYQLKDRYYIPKFSYIEHSENNKYIYKKIQGGRRKTRRSKSKKSNKTRSRKH